MFSSVGTNLKYQYVAMAENDIPFENSKDLPLELKEIVAGIEDVTDPSSMDKLMEYVDFIRNEDDNFMKLLTEKCKDKAIYWEQPWFQKLLFKLHGPAPVSENESIKCRSDTICLEEHQLIKKNWRKFRKRYKLPDRLISFARWKNYKCRNASRSPEERARLYAVAFLSRGLKRAYSQVFYHISRRIAGHRSGYFTELDDKIIHICVHHKPAKISTVLSLLLARQPRGITQRLAFLKYGSTTKKRVKWNLPLASKLVKHMVERSQLQLEQLKNRRVEASVWRAVGEDLSHDWLLLRHFWYTCLHVQLFVTDDVKLRKSRRKVFKMLLHKVNEGSWQVWTDIRWGDVVSEFPDGFTARFLYRLCRASVVTMEGYRHEPLADVVEYAFHKIRTQVRKIRNRRLRRLAVDSRGQLEELPRDPK